MTTLYPFTAPRDAKSPVIERLEWLTDVQLARTGFELRRAQRAFPRQTYSYAVYVRGTASIACMEALQAGETSFMVPLWPHVFERPAVAPDAGVYSRYALVGGVPVERPNIMQLDHSAAYLSGVAPLVGWSSAYHLAAPAAPARFSGTSRSFMHLGGTRPSSGQVSFRLENGFEETVGSYTGAMSVEVPELPLLDAFTSTASGLTDQTDEETNTYDNGHFDLYESKYFQRNYSVTLTLSTRAQVLQFRRLLWRLQGRFGMLRWTAPGDAVERTWRLSADTVELSYLRPGYATTTISLKQLF